MRNETCIVCGIEFAIANSLYWQRLEDGKTFCCPNGHRQRYSEYENKRLIKKIERLESNLFRAVQEGDSWHLTCRHVESSRAAHQGVATKRLREIERLKKEQGHDSNAIDVLLRDLKAAKREIKRLKGG